LVRFARIHDSLQDLIAHLMSFLFFAASIVICFYLSPETWQHFPYLIIGTIGLNFAEMVGTLLLKHMTKETYVLIHRTYVPMIILLIYLFSGFVPSLRNAILIGYILAIWSSYFQFVVMVIHGLTTFLNIRLLKIPYPPKAS